MIRTTPSYRAGRHYGAFLLLQASRCSTPCHQRQAQKRCSSTQSLRAQLPGGACVARAAPACLLSCPLPAALRLMAIVSPPVLTASETNHWVLLRIHSLFSLQKCRVYGITLCNGTQCGLHQCAQLMGLCFAVIAPLILPPVAFFFFTAWVRGYGTTH